MEDSTVHCFTVRLLLQLQLESSVAVTVIKSCWVMDHNTCPLSLTLFQKIWLHSCSIITSVSSEQEGSGEVDNIKNILKRNEDPYLGLQAC